MIGTVPQHVTVIQSASPSKDQESFQKYFGFQVEQQEEDEDLQPLRTTPSSQAIVLLRDYQSVVLVPVSSESSSPTASNQSPFSILLLDDSIMTSAREASTDSKSSIQQLPQVEWNSFSIEPKNSDPISISAGKMTLSTGHVVVVTTPTGWSTPSARAKLLQYAIMKSQPTSVSTSISRRSIFRARLYEESPLCWCPRFFFQHFPRLFSLFFAVILPLWILIGISVLFGVLLARYEAPHEQESNYAILESRARLNRTIVNTTEIAQLPVLCYLKYLNETDSAKFEERINEYIFISSNMENRDATNTTNITDADLNYTVGDIVDETEEELYLFMLKCQQEQTAKIGAYLKVLDEYGDSAADSLSFNWIRCWPKEKKYDKWAELQFIYFPRDFLIEASRPTQQEAAVETEFVRILSAEESICLELGGEEDECFEDALRDASEGASNVCHKNLESTSWFFFTIMTTVGYGNQAPVTTEGRLVIYIAGIASLILFATVLGSAGYIITAIFDDAVSRLPFSKFLQHPLIGVVLWGGIWAAWAYWHAQIVYDWWSKRLPDFDVDVEDAMWFAFISASTIGLGDYFLQPEVIFASDALATSYWLLVGFVFLSTYLNKIRELISGMLPKRQNSLESRLKNTNLIFWPRNKACMHKEKETAEEVSSEQLQQEMQQQEERVENYQITLAT